MRSRNAQEWSRFGRIPPVRWRTVQRVASLRGTSTATILAHTASARQRSPADLPISNWCVRLHWTVKRCRCRVAACAKATFAEALPDLLARKAKRTDRLTTGLGAVALAVGSQAGSRLAHKLNMPASGDTLLRIIRAMLLPTSEELDVLGVDDWAQRRSRIYGTI